MMDCDDKNSCTTSTSARFFRVCCGSLAPFELCLFIICLLLLTALLSVSVFWLVILEGFKILTEGFPTWEQHRTLVPFAINDSQMWPPLSSISSIPSVCVSRECTLIAGFLMDNLNDQLDPCDDFYEYACGNYRLNHELSVKPIRHTISDVTSRVRKQIKSLLEMNTKETDSDSDRLAKDYYQKCLQEETLAREGRSTIIDLLNTDLGGWPVVLGTAWQEWPHSWQDQLALLVGRTGINSVIVEFAVVHDPKNSSRTVIELDQPKWGIGTRHPYLNGIDDPSLRNYTQLMVEIAVLFGADRKRAAVEMRKVVEFELEIVRFSTSEQLRRDANRTYNPFQMFQLSDEFPHVRTKS